MDIAAMNVRVTFQENRVVTDAIGNHKNAWEDCYTCFATISGESGTEQAVVGETVENTDMSVTVRWCAETAAMSSTRNRILFNGEIYNILAIDHLSFHRRGIKFKCRRVRR